MPMTPTEAQIATIRDYANQVLDHSFKLSQALKELNKNLARLPVADIVKAGELEAREKALAEREREMQERWRRAEALLEE